MQLGKFVYLTRCRAVRASRFACVRKNFLRTTRVSDKSAARSRAAVQRLLLCHFEFEQQSFIVESSNRNFAPTAEARTAGIRKLPTSGDAIANVRCIYEYWWPG